MCVSHVSVSCALLLSEPCCWVQKVGVTLAQGWHAVGIREVGNTSTLHPHAPLPIAIYHPYTHTYVHTHAHTHTHTHSQMRVPTHSHFIL